MTLLFNWRVWVALALSAGLAFTHFVSYRSGKAKVRAEWAIEKQAHAEAVAAASEAARMKEKSLTITNDGITNAFIKEKARLVADGRITAERLRDLKASLDSTASYDTAPLGGSDDPRDRIIDQCATALVRLDEYAKSVASTAIGLQSYTREVCLKP